MQGDYCASNSQATDRFWLNRTSFIGEWVSSEVDRTEFGQRLQGADVSNLIVVQVEQSKIG